MPSSGPASMPSSGPASMLSSSPASMLSSVPVSPIERPTIFAFTARRLASLKVSRLASPAWQLPLQPYRGRERGARPPRLAGGAGGSQAARRAARTAERAQCLRLLPRPREGRSDACVRCGDEAARWLLGAICVNPRSGSGCMIGYSYKCERQCTANARGPRGKRPGCFEKVVRARSTYRSTDSYYRRICSAPCCIREGS